MFGFLYEVGAFLRHEILIIGWEVVCMFRGTFGIWLRLLLLFSSLLIILREVLVVKLFGDFSDSALLLTMRLILVGLRERQLAIRLNLRMLSRPLAAGGSFPAFLPLTVHDC